MENLKLTTKTLSKMSLIINKMGIASLILDLNVESGDEKRDYEIIMKKLIKLVVENLYKAEDEITLLISELKGISKEEAENEDIIPIFKELFNNEKIKSFFESL